MNIFRLADSPEESATLQCDKHVVKMPLETAQLLCSAHPEGVAPYKRTHYNHPSAVWVRESIDNYFWAIDHGLELCDEYHRRYGAAKGKQHASRAVIEWAATNLPDLPAIGPTPMPQCMPEEYQVAGDPVAAYRKYYRGDKSSIAAWKHTDRPAFMETV